MNLFARNKNPVRARREIINDGFVGAIGAHLAAGPLASRVERMPPAETGLVIPDQPGERTGPSRWVPGGHHAEGDVLGGVQAQQTGLHVESMSQPAAPSDAQQHSGTNTEGGRRGR